MTPAQRPAGRPRTLQADAVRARLDETRGRTLAERVARGKAAWAAVPRESHAAYTPAGDRGGRSGDRIAIAAYLGKSAAFDDAVADFATGYAEQNERDYASLRHAVSAGKITAERGV